MNIWSWNDLGQSWGGLGRSCGASWDPLGDLLVPSWVPLGSSWVLLGPLRSILGLPGGHLMGFWGGSLVFILEALQNEQFVPRLGAVLE